MKLVQAALDLALSAADEVSRDRYLESGRRLVPVDDLMAQTGTGWLHDTGLHYNQVQSATVKLLYFTMSKS